MFRIEISQDIQSLFADEDCWNKLAGGVPFRETSWLRPWWNHFGTPGEAYVVIAKDDDGVTRGILPLFRSADCHRHLEVVGGGQACSDHASILVQRDDVAEVARSMAEYLADHASDSQWGWDTISIDGVVDGDQPMAEFSKAIEEAGAALHAQSRMSTWFKPSDDSWDEHLKHFGKTQRRKMRRWSERIDKTDGLEKSIVDRLDDVQDALDSLIDMHQRRWNAEGEPGSYADAEFAAFVRDSADDFFRRGRLYLPTLSMDDKVIGGELHFIGGDNRLYCYSSGYDIDSAELEPGRILCVETLLELYRRDLAGIDYLRGDEPYKKRMAATPTRIFHLRVIAPTLLPRLRHAAWCAGFELKQWVRRHTGRKPIEVASTLA